MSGLEGPRVVRVLVAIVAIGSVLSILIGVTMLADMTVETYLVLSKWQHETIVEYDLLAGMIGLVLTFELWRGWKWAWTIALIIHIISIIAALLSLPIGIPGVVLDGIVLYLLMRRDTRRFFFRLDTSGLKSMTRHVH